MTHQTRNQTLYKIYFIGSVSELSVVTKERKCGLGTRKGSHNLNQSNSTSRKAVAEKLLKNVGRIEAWMKY